VATSTPAATDIGLFEAIYSARSLRHFKPDPVPQALITRVLDAAIRASSGGNTQHWSFVVVRDPGAKSNRPQTRQSLMSRRWRGSESAAGRRRRIRPSRRNAAGAIRSTDARSPDH
jgi:nitroreductase